VPDGDDRRGFRLLSDAEYPIASRAGVGTHHDFGTSPSLVPMYAHCGPFHPFKTVVAGLKPNDLGLFDTVGNVMEYTRSTSPEATDEKVADLCGGYVLRVAHKVNCDMRLGPASVFVAGGTLFNGFRVARTIAGP